MYRGNIFLTSAVFNLLFQYFQSRMGNGKESRMTIKVSHAPDDVLSWELGVGDDVHLEESVHHVVRVKRTQDPGAK